MLFALVAVLMALAAPVAAANTTNGEGFAGRPEVAAFAADVAARRGLERTAVADALARARKSADVQRLIMPPPTPTAKNWVAYRDRFVEPKRVQAGVEFWRRHAADLARAEARHGVPPEIVAAIIGVETFYGRFMGSFRVLDALATLAFDFPPGRRDRSAFFRSELEEFLVWSAREGLDPAATRGSYAGAIGLPQFMPGSINRWAVDFDANGHIDLIGSPADAIGSVAKYLEDFGWQRGLATHFEVALPDSEEDRAFLLGPDIVPSFTSAEFAARGARVADPRAEGAGLLALVELHNGGATPTYVAGTQNFYAITRYNWSSYYALAVATLAEALKTARPAVASR